MKEIKKNKKNWYILKIKNGYEQIIKKKLNYFKKKKKILCKIFNPFLKKKKIKNGKKYYLKKKFYPGYLIINIFLNKNIFYKIKKINGVYNFLNERINNLPLPLNNIEINNIIKNYKYFKKNKKKKYNLYKKYKIGDNVKIIEGIFKSLSGNIDKIYKKKKKIKLIVMFFGRKIPIKININQIKNNNEKNN
ncbi:MAG: hypothetical protein NHF93_00030 [Candidatus Shikimatogenerans bostrichidophilus]|nr:MAG: hypothetical protein NHF93_00030 [Candidatus Shikimatogenerans bostrichidophilus]